MARIKVVNKIKAAGQTRVLNVRPDAPDIRDRYYEPALVPLADTVDNRGTIEILDQGTEGACTGFALAAVINLLARRRNADFSASPRMLYEMAQRHDRWPGEDYEGSSCRGAIRGWANMGVCSEQDWPYVANQPDELTIDRAKAARSHPLGAYYRLRPVVSDYHAALNEVDAVYVSARIHTGWLNPAAPGGEHDAVIVAGGTPIGGHAFVIVGYEPRGFIVQNSWSPGWGSSGYALWRYEDWQDTVSDGWVFRLGIPTPQIFGVAARAKAPAGEAEFFNRKPPREEIAGHFAHLDNGEFAHSGKYWTNAGDIQRTADLIHSQPGKYPHLLVYAHGGLNAPADSARRIAAMKGGFKRNGVYPFHIMYDTGLVKSLLEVISGAGDDAAARSQGLFDWLVDNITDMTDGVVEDLVRAPGTAIWQRMKHDARSPFELTAENPEPDGLLAMRILMQTLAGSGIKVHLVGHSTGAVLLGHLLNALDSLNSPDLLSSCSLLAPACQVDFYRQHYEPRLAAAFAGTRLPTLDVYNLKDKQERDDQVAGVYRKSLLYLVSRALEESRTPAPLLGMQKHNNGLAANGLTITYAAGNSASSRSTTHGGFDNDPHTMNAVLQRVLGHAPAEPFTESDIGDF